MSDCLPGCRCKCGDVLDNDRHDPLLAYGPVFHRFEAKTHAPHCPNAEPPKPVQERCAVGGCTRTPDPDERYCTPHQTPTKPSAEPPHDVASDCLPECHKSEVIGGVVHDGDHSPDCPKSDQDVASEPDFEAAERLLGDLTIADYLTRNDSCRDYCSGCGVMITNRFDILGEPCEPPTVHKKTCKNVVIPVIKKAYLALRAENAALKAEVESLKARESYSPTDMASAMCLIQEARSERDEARAEASHYRETGRDMCATGHYPIRYSPEEEFGPCPLCVATAEAQKLREERDAAVEHRNALRVLVHKQTKILCDCGHTVQAHRKCVACGCDDFYVEPHRREEKGGE